MVSIHPAAIVSKKARIAEDVKIGPLTIIEDDVVIGKGTVIDSSVSIKDGATAPGSAKM
jgi:UDP-N-acetylglucosamine acyltransferase